MAVRISQLIPAKDAEAVQTTQYTATNCTTIIDKLTATNETVGNLILSVNILQPSGSASTANRIISLRAIGPGETYLCPEVVGHLIPANGSISTLASATGLTIAATGREIT